jgi:hypothetical protein
MKKIALIFAFLSTLMVWGQEKDTLRMSVNGNEIIILTDDINNLSETDFNSIIERLTAETKRIIEENQRTMAEIARQQEAGEITAEEADEMREEAIEQMEDDLEELSDEIENWADRYGEQVEEDAEDAAKWAEQWESNAEKYDAENERPSTTTKKEGTTVIIDDDGIRINGEDPDWDPEDIKKKKEEYKRNQTIGYFEMYFGWNNWVNGNGLATNEMPPANGLNQTTELNFWPSMNWGFGFGGKSRMGASKMYFRYGLQFNWHYFQLKGNNVIVKAQDPNLDFDGVYFMADQSRNYSKTSLRMIYLDAPLMFEFDNSKPGRSNGFSLALGGYGGIRLGVRNKLCFSDFNGDKSKVFQHNNIYTNGFRYGALAQIGFGTFKITGKYDLNTLFRTDRNTPDYQIASLTLGWVFP